MDCKKVEPMPYQLLELVTGTKIYFPCFLFQTVPGVRDAGMVAGVTSYVEKITSMWGLQLNDKKVKLWTKART